MKVWLGKNNWEEIIDNQDILDKIPKDDIATLYSLLEKL
jgi:hypothetical protein